jgi:hypothetical protein
MVAACIVRRNIALGKLSIMVQRKHIFRKRPQATKIITEIQLEAPDKTHAARRCVNADNVIQAMCVNAVCEVP